MKSFYMTVGVPAAGKSTFIKNFLEAHKDDDFIVLSSDSYIEAFAQTKGLTYTDVFSECIKDAESAVRADLEYALLNGRNVIWDQTNLTKKSRARKLAGIPNGYRKVAVYFETPSPEEHARRLNSRPGKTIPDYVIANMIKQIEIPTEDEGFDQIIFNR